MMRVQSIGLVLLSAFLVACASKVPLDEPQPKIAPVSERSESSLTQPSAEAPTTTIKTEPAKEPVATPITPTPATATLASATPIGQAPGVSATATGSRTSEPATSAGNVSSSSNTSVKPVVAEAAPAFKPNTIYFDFDSFEVKPEFQTVLEQQAKALTANRKLKISLHGHTDDVGGREYNIALGQKRADAVKRTLGILGVTDAQMEAVSFGKEKPAVVANDDAARAKNRRVEIIAAGQ